MSQEELDKKIAERLHKIFPDPQVARQVIDTVTSSKPEGWSKRSYPPYFKKEYALQVKEWIDQMIAKLDAGDKDSMIVLLYETWCSPSGMNPNTLYVRVNQSIRFLIDRLDTDDHYYGKWYESVEISREKNLGVVIKWRQEYLIAQGKLEGPVKKPVFIQPPEEKPRWLRQVDQYLQSNTTEPLVIEHLILSEEEIIQLKTRFAQLSNVMVDVQPNSIRVIRFNEDE